MTLDERKLAAKIRRGDRQAFDTLFGCYADRVTGFALRLTGSRVEAEDLVQSVFLGAYTGHRTFAGRSGLLAWLLGIAARRWRDQCRRRGPEMTSMTAEGLETVDRPHHPLEDAVIDTMTLDHALARLSPPFREALLLVGSQGLSYKEAAEAMGEPVGTIKWRVSEATRRMRGFINSGKEGSDAPETRPADAGADRLPCGG